MSSLQSFKTSKYLSLRLFFACNRIHPSVSTVCHSIPSLFIWMLDAPSFITFQTCRHQVNQQHSTWPFPRCPTLSLWLTRHLNTTLSTPSCDTSFLPTPVSLPFQQRLGITVATHTYSNISYTSSSWTVEDIFDLDWMREVRVFMTFRRRQRQGVA